MPVVATVCCALGIADFNRPVRRFHVERFKRYLELAYELEGEEHCCWCSANTSGSRK